MDAAASGACRGRRAGLSSVSERSAQTTGADPAKPQGGAGRLRTAKPCGPGTRCWCQAGGGASTQPGPNNPSIRRRRRQKRTRLRGEPGISRKTIAQGMSDALRCPVCSCASHHSFAHETAGAARTRHSLRPPSSRGAEIAVKLRALRAARLQRCVQCKPRHCERSDLSAVARRAKAEAIHCHLVRNKHVGKIVVTL